MLAEVRRRLAGGRWPAEPELVHGEVEAIDDLVPEGSFDLILCHNLIEYVADPQAVLLSLARRLVPSGLLSLVTANPTGDAIRLALLEHDLPGAQQALERRTSTAALFDGIPKRSFSPAQIDLLLQRAGIDRTDRYGVRVFADYLPERALEAPGSEDALFELEREAGRIEEYRALARYWHLIGRQTAADFIRR
jgi:SAM-dependent methyltransferase